MTVQGSYPVGAVLIRNTPVKGEPNKIQVIGTGNELIVTPVDEFGSNFPLSAAKARSDWHSDSDIIGANQTEHALSNYIDPGPSPEQVFEAQERADGIVRDPNPLTRIQKAELRAKGVPADLVAASEAAAQKVDTGRPVLNVNNSFAPEPAVPEHIVEPTPDPEPETPLVTDKQAEVAAEVITPLNPTDSDLDQAFGPVVETVEVSPETTA